jgi:hypothetical protein
MNLYRLKKIHKIFHAFSTGSRICSRICTWTQNHGSGSDLASILIEFIWFFQNLINFRRTKNIFILGGFEIFWMFWKAMSLNRSFLGFMMPGNVIYHPPQRKREATFRKNPGWAPSPMCTTLQGGLDPSGAGRKVWPEGVDEGGGRHIIRSSRDAGLKGRQQKTDRRRLTPRSTEDKMVCSAKRGTPKHRQAVKAKASSH